MSIEFNPQLEMDRAFENYFAMSDILRNDLTWLLDHEENSELWRRNFLRSAVVMVEGYAQCLRDMCSIGVKLGEPGLTEKEIKSICNEGGLSSAERIKYNIRAAYKLFHLEPIPDFGSAGWSCAKDFIEKRNALTHPKTPSDLCVGDDVWQRYREGYLWVFKVLFDHLALMREKYG